MATAGFGAAGVAAPASGSSPTTTVENVAPASVEHERDRATRNAFEIIAKRDREYRQAEGAPPKANAGPPLLKSQLRQGEPLGSAPPPPKDQTPMILAGTAISLAFLALAGVKWAEHRKRHRQGTRRRWLSELGAWRRRNAALLIVVGFAIVAASVTVMKPSNLPYEYRDYVRDGWLAFTGVAVALIGIYDIIRTKGPPEI